MPNDQLVRREASLRFYDFVLQRYRYQFCFAVQATYPYTPAPKIIDVRVRSLIPIANFRSIILITNISFSHTNFNPLFSRNQTFVFWKQSYNYQQMLQSISNLFSTPIIPRNYQPKPSLRSYATRPPIKRYGRSSNNIDKETADIIQSLTKPIQTWIIQKQPYLKTIALNKVINDYIMESKLSNFGQQNQQKKVTIHNLFILIIQYKILNERVKQMGIEQVEGYISGLCKIFLEEEKGPLDQLTCLLHFVISNSRSFMCENLKDNLNTCLFKALDLSSSKAQSFITLYSQIQQKNKEEFIDIVVNIIPMMTELSKVIVKTEKGYQRIYLLKNIQWLNSIGLKLLDVIAKDVQSVYSKKDVSNEPINNPSLRKRLSDKGNQLIQIEGILTTKVLFSYAYKQLYYFQYCLRLHMYMTELSSLDEKYSIYQQTHNLNLVKKLLKLCCKYEFNLPDTNLQFLANILQESLFDSSQINQLYLPNLKNANLQIFIEDLKSSPTLQGDSCYNQDQQQQFDFYFEKDDSMVSYILQMLYSLKLEYLQLLKIIMIKTGKGYIEILQFYLIKNGFLHFLVEELQSIQTTDKKLLEDYFQILGLLLHKNNAAYFIMNDILHKEYSQSEEKSNLVEYIRKNFIHAKKLLLIMLSDTIYINSKKQFNRYFLPFPLESLLYNYFKNNNIVKHDVWTSYIHDVIVRQLENKKQKDKIKKCYYEQQISEWVMLAILLQAELMTYKNGSDIDLWQFTMAYLTNMLQQAIKWNPDDETSVMRKILKSYEEWQIYYTQKILQTETGEDIIQSRFGPTVNFLYLRKWNRKICNSIKVFIQSVSTTKVEDIKDFKLI